MDRLILLLIIITVIVFILVMYYVQLSITGINIGVDTIQLNNIGVIW